MAETAVAARTRNVKTITEETLPVSDGENKGLGMPWDEWLATISDDELAITVIYVYRKDPPTISGFLLRSGGDGQSAERIDSAWLQRYCGGGTYDLTIRSKSGKSHYERGVKIAGEPKLTPKEQAAALPSSANPAPSNDSATERLAGLVDKLIDRLSNLQTPAPTPAPSAAHDASVRIMAEAASEGIKLVASQTRGDKPEGDSFTRDFQQAMMKRFLEPPKERSLDEELQRLKTLKEILQPAQAEQGIAAQIGQLATIIEALDKIRGDGGGRGDWKGALVEQIGNAVPHLVDAAKNIMDGRTKEAEAAARAQAARAAAAASVERIRGGQPPLTTPMAPGPVPPGAPSAAPAASADWGGPLNVVPISGPAPATAPGHETAAATSAEIQEATVIDRYFKSRVVALIAEGAHPGMVLDFIDGASPQIGALLSRATERQIREFLAADEVLVQATRLPNFEAFLKGMLAELAEGDDEPAEEPPSPTRVQ